MIYENTVILSEAKNLKRGKGGENMNPVVIAVAAVVVIVVVAVIFKMKKDK